MAFFSRNKKSRLTNLKQLYKEVRREATTVKKLQKLAKGVRDVIADLRRALVSNTSDLKKAEAEDKSLSTDSKASKDEGDTAAVSSRREELGINIAFLTKQVREDDKSKDWLNKQLMKLLDDTKKAQRKTK